MNLPSFCSKKPYDSPAVGRWHSWSFVCSATSRWVSGATWAEWVQGTFCYSHLISDTGGFPFWVQLYLKVPVLHFCQPWGWPWDKKCAPEALHCQLHYLSYHLPIDELSRMPESFIILGDKSQFSQQVLRFGSPNLAQFKWLPARLQKDEHWSCCREGLVTLYDCFYQDQDIPSYDTVHFEVQIVSIDVK